MMPKSIPANLRSAYISEVFGVLMPRGLDAVSKIHPQLTPGTEVTGGPFSG